MKTIGEITQEQSLTAYEDLGGTVTEPGKRTPTPSAGSGTGSMNALTTNLPRPAPEQVADILSLARSIKPWEIAPDDQKAAKAALKVLDYCLIPATYDEAAYWIGRMLAHFPRRDTAGDGVVIADLAGSAIEAGATLIAIAAVTETVWKAGTKKNPWLPPSGEILTDVIERTKFYQSAAQRIRNPRPAISSPIPREDPPAAWAGQKWDDMPDATRAELWAFLAPLMPQVRRTYCRVIEVDYEAVLAWAEVNIKEKVENATDEDQESA